MGFVEKRRLDYTSDFAIVALVAVQQLWDDVVCLLWKLHMFDATLMDASICVFCVCASRSRLVFLKIFPLVCMVY